MDIERIKAVEKKWMARWQAATSSTSDIDNNRQKYYCLDMFPYPSGSGLHVGHPRGYITTDVYSRFKQMHGLNVLHPMGFDAFGLPAEQYAIETGQHPATTTANNVATFKRQLANLGLFYDQTRELSTADPSYYRWTQWIFSRLFDSWFCLERRRAVSICELQQHLDKHGTVGLRAFTLERVPALTAAQWADLSTQERADLLMNYRLAYRADTFVNWCPKLGTVLANDEVIDGYSERGGHPVVKRKLKQWMLRITAYADRLIDGLDSLHWPASVKQMQRNWIGRSTGTTVFFSLCSNDGRSLEAFTSQPDNLVSVAFLALSPEHPDIQSLTIPSLREAMTEHLRDIELRSMRERNKAFCSGCFTGSHALHPLTNAVLPIWVTDYLAFEGGSTVALGMPSVNDQDRRFAEQFDLAMDSKLPERQACNAAALLAPQPATRYRMRDAVFGRQRYWGEPIPIYYDDDGIAHALPDDQLPLELPQIDAYLPTEEGDPPLQRAQDWRYGDCDYEKTTMPGWAGSSWYFLRYADPQNSIAPIGPQAARYWNSVDLYVGGAEHATGHLLYARFWTHFLKDLGIIEFAEPFNRIVCQGMILGSSAIIYRDVESQAFVSAELVNGRQVQPLHIDIKLVNDNCEVDLPRLREWRDRYREAEFECVGGHFFCDRQIEKMSKSKHNVVNPDDLIDLYGADAFRLHSLFLGPIEQSAVWSTDSIDGAYKFVQRVWRLFANDNGQSLVDTATPTREELKVLHTAIDKVSRDTESLSFNTAIAALMVCASQLTKLNCHKDEILAPFLQLLHPFAPFMTQELWASSLGRDDSLVQSTYPTVNQVLLQEEHFTCPVTINGKLRSHVTLSIAMSAEEMEQCALEDATIKNWISGQTVKKVVVVKGRLVNLVVV